MSAVEPRVVADGVSKWFGPLVAVSDVSFDVGPGVTALLGPNGAGKSTMFRHALRARPARRRAPFASSARDPRADTGVTRLIGLVPQQESVFEPLTAREFVALSARLHGLADPEAAAASALETVGLDPSDRRRLPTYSKGMRQRVKVAQAIVHDPPVLILDEPLTGLDPRQRADLVTLFRRLGERRALRDRVQPRARRGGAARLAGARHVAGPARRCRRLPRAARADGRPADAGPGAHRPPARARGRRCSQRRPPSASGSTATSVLELDTTDARALARALAPVARERRRSLFEVRPLDADLEGVFRYVVQR